MARRPIRLRLTRTAENTPKTYDDAPEEDETMPDATNEEVPIPEDDDKDSEHVEDNDDEEDEDDKASRDGDSDGEKDGEEEEEEEDKGGEPAPPPPQRERSPLPAGMVRRKRLGRPPKNKPPDWDPMVVVPYDEARDTPRRRGRGGYRGRGGRKGGPSAPKAEQVIDAEGTIAEIANDECVLPEDPEGEQKVDKNGNLSGGRDYRCRVFTVLGRGERLYMLSTEPARCVGFRDSYLFFTKHRKLHKIIVDDDEKRDMIERDIIPHSYKGRSIGIVTARSVFREFGARIIIGGKRIVDDYNVAQARADGVVEGQLADPDDRFNPSEPYNKNQYVAWHGASAVYHTQTPSVPVPNGKPQYAKRKVNLNDMNWMFEHAREASIFNARINEIRKLNNAGVYDIHTNTMHYPKMMQPTRARIEQVPVDEEDKASAEDTIFTPVPAKVAKNFFVTDTYLEIPPAGLSKGAYEHRDPHDPLASFNGLGVVPDEIKSLLPPECRKAFDTALDHETEWKSRWGAESKTMSRREPVIDKAIVPYSMS
ncbi:chromatin remodelling complex Rsc7/Swp82 subunit-domain-containing protein [Emericellopsis atlantica]|uniref:Chromatin remodelling complex Rsc7/Swp82 subunit-domain-containing protein n=1 Tax=Emericellopsis atlantica TaxID=2614577 RepID=A0A9P7ZNU8_9HYPO|nr:chromatin remodelling complex Rsc7/Swp82 subunit-domain-containing protein [Emericellopsis atlantica]KAG9255142.1 chromatin remodelling complex Rsc7/Swp82 subunit-domain-containing protein [Emericellopsis atlantica]